MRNIVSAILAKEIQDRGFPGPETPEPGQYFFLSRVLFMFQKTTEYAGTTHYEFLRFPKKAGDEYKVALFSQAVFNKMIYAPTATDILSMLDGEHGLFCRKNGEASVGNALYFFTKKQPSRGGRRRLAI